MYRPGPKRTVQWNRGWSVPEITVEPNPGEGCEFRFTVEAQTAEEAVEAARRHSGYFLGGLDAKFDFRAFRVAILGAERLAEVSERQEPSAALALGDGGQNMAEEIR